MIRRVLLSITALAASCLSAVADPQFQGSALSALQGRVTANATTAANALSIANLAVQIKGGDASATNITDIASGFARSAALHLHDLPISEANFTGGACTGAADDTCSIQAAIVYACTKHSDAIYLSKLYYGISAPLDTTFCTGLHFMGRGPLATVIYQSTLNVPIIHNGGISNKFSGFQLTYSSTPVAGADAIRENGDGSEWSSFRVTNGWNGFNDAGAGSVDVHDFVINDTLNTALLFDANSIGGNFVNFQAATSDPTKFANGAISLNNHTEAINFINGEVLGGVYSLTTSSVSYTFGARPAYNRFVNMYFDSSAKGSLIDKMVMSQFIGGWFSAGRTGPGYCGVEIVSGDSLTFTGTDFFNNGACGAQVDPNAKRVSFNGVTANDNSVIAGSGASPGILIKAGTTDFSIIAGKGANGLLPANISGNNPPGQQSYYTQIEAGSSDRYVITGNLVAGNVKGGISDGGTGINKTVQDDNGGFAFVRVHGGAVDGTPIGSSVPSTGVFTNLAVGTPGTPGSAIDFALLDDTISGAAWNAGDVTIGNTAATDSTGATSGALGFAYSKANKTAYIGAVAPGYSWLPVVFKASLFQWVSSGGTVGLSQDGSGNVTANKLLTVGAALKLPAYTVASLPTCAAGTQDYIAVVSDATAPTYRGALTGGGSIRTPVYCDGLNWTAR